MGAWDHVEAEHYTPPKTSSFAPWGDSKRRALVTSDKRTKDGRGDVVCTCWAVVRQCVARCVLLPHTVVAMTATDHDTLLNQKMSQERTVNFQRPTNQFATLNTHLSMNAHAPAHNVQHDKDKPPSLESLKTLTAEDTKHWTKAIYSRWLVVAGVAQHSGKRQELHDLLFFLQQNVVLKGTMDALQLSA